MKEIRYSFNGKILTMVLIGVIMVCSSILMQLYNPLQLITNKLLTLEPGTLLFKLWADPPYEVTLKLFIFNVTNSEEFLRGEEKLNVTEVGPFCYREILTNVNASVNYDDGTLTFTPNREYIVDLECSIMDPKLAKIIAPNIPLLGIQSYLIDMSFLTNIGFSTLSATLGAKSFVNITTHEYFWGYEDKLVTLANQFVPNWIDFGTFGIIERLLSRDNINEVTISIDPSKYKSRYAHLLTPEEQSAQFHITKWNNLEGFPEWGYKSDNNSITSTKRCHLVEGDFDGTIYPRPMTKNLTITMFRKAFCRPITLVFDEESLTKQGFRSYNYKVSKNLFESPELNPNNECYCRNGICPRDGVQDIGVCYYDMPILLSKPHFLDSPKKLIESVNGIEPDEIRHSSVAKLQPDLGIPLDGSSLKIQVNLGVGETKYNTKTKPFNNLTVPILWLELTCQKLPPLVTFLLKLVIDILPISQKILIYLTGLIGLTLISGAALLILFFSKNVPRSMSIVSDYAALPLITIPANFLKEKELRIYK